jgi:thioredoxin-related protein
MKPVIVAALAILTIATAVVWVQRNRAMYFAQTLAEQPIPPPMIKADAPRPNPPQPQTPAQNRPKDSSSAKPSIYDKNADVRQQVAAATARAKSQDKRVLLMFGGDWCNWCHKLHDLFDSNAEIHKLLSNEYELVLVETKAPHAQELLDECSKGQAEVGFPFLAVMDATGKRLVGQRTGPLEEGDHHDPKKVKEFLARWTVEPKDAQAVLRDALGKASSQDKKVFLTCGAPWCGWCHRLEDFLARTDIAPIMDRDFVVLKIDIDRMTRGKDVMEKYLPEESRRSTGIPWYVILDAKGEKLATSDLLPGPIKNIGYPNEPQGIDAFITLLKGHARRIETSHFAQLRKELETAGARIHAEAKQ